MGETMGIALITGASSGFGEETARRLAKEGWNLILCTRSIDKLQKLSREINKQYNVQTLPIKLDVSSRTDCENLPSQLTQDWSKIDVLINNAGNAYGKDTLARGNMDDFESMIDTNLKGLIFLTKSILPILLKRPKAHICNIGSIAGDSVYPGGGIYCTTKIGVEFISNALRIELVDKPIKVTNIKPGLAKTNFSLTRFAGDTKKAEEPYQGITPLYAKDIADAISYVIHTPDHVQISELTIVPTHQANMHYVHKEK